MSILLENVRVPQVAQLRELVTMAEGTPTGARVMSDLATAPTNVELFTAAEWLEDASRRGVAARFDRVANRFLLPIEALPGAPHVDPLEGRAIALVHEGEHRLQGRPGIAHVVKRLTIEPWQLWAAERRMPGGAMARAVRDEVDAHVLDRQFGAELAARRGRVPADVPPREAIEADILGERMYAWQARQQVAGAKLLRGVHLVGGGVVGAGVGVGVLGSRD
jgi:hypothetical protein